MDLSRAVNGGFFLRKKPLERLLPLHSNSENAVGAPPHDFSLAQILSRVCARLRAVRRARPGRSRAGNARSRARHCGLCAAGRAGAAHAERRAAAIHFHARASTGATNCTRAGTAFPIATGARSSRSISSPRSGPRSGARKRTARCAAIARGHPESSPARFTKSACIRAESVPRTGDSGCSRTGHH